MHDDSFGFGSDHSHYFEIRKLHRKIGELRQRMGELRVDDADELRGVLSMIDQLERDLGRSLLMLHATIETLVENQLLTHEQLAAKAAELDALDSEVDGRLDPALFRTEEELNRVPSAKIHLHRLEQQESVTPRDFLKGLEESP